MPILGNVENQTSQMVR